MLKGITLSLWAILFLNYSSYAQHKPGNKSMLHQHCRYGEIVEIKMNEALQFEDTLTVSLTAFSHKKPITGGPTKATAYLSLSHGDVREQITLSVHGVEGKPASDTGAQHYDAADWNNYQFQLKSFNYDKSIKIIVFKKNQNTKQ